MSNLETLQQKWNKKKNFGIKLLIFSSFVILFLLGCVEKKNPTLSSPTFSFPSDPLTEIVEDVSTATPSPATTPDFRLGFVTEREGCQLMTEIVALILEQEWGLTIENIGYHSTNDMFDAVSSGNTDLTFCFMSPEDDPLWRDKEKFGQIKQIGAMHWKDANENKWRLVAKLRIKSELRKKHPKLFCFFEKLRFSEMTFQETDPQHWIQTHTPDIQSWLEGCK